ncbi:Fe-S-binding ATPase, partial [Pectobacterium brasiliense]|nr:Fe-S-binding ATPase [Pectobacterium brasiliense]
MNATVPYQRPEALRAIVTGVLSTFPHPTLKNKLTTMNALRHCALLDN